MEFVNHSRSSRSVATKGSDPARAEDGDLDASEKRDYFPWDIMSGNAAERKHAALVPFTEFKTGGDVAHLATSQASPAGSPQKPHRRTTL